MCSKLPRLTDRGVCPLRGPGACSVCDVRGAKCSHHGPLQAANAASQAARLGGDAQEPPYTRYIRGTPSTDSGTCSPTVSDTCLSRKGLSATPELPGCLIQFQDMEPSPPEARGGRRAAPGLSEPGARRPRIWPRHVLGSSGSGGGLRGEVQGPLLRASLSSPLDVPSPQAPDAKAPPWPDLPTTHATQPCHCHRPGP